mgnify:CR=1 FL=1
MMPPNIDWSKKVKNQLNRALFKPKTKINTGLIITGIKSGKIAARNKAKILSHLYPKTKGIVEVT